LPLATGLGLAAREEFEGLPTAAGRSVDGTLGQTGQRQQQRHDALQHHPLPLDLPVPTQPCHLRTPFRQGSVEGARGRRIK